MTEIPPGALTQTFRDAIKVAQALGIDYIDSLCIIQDKDSDDWSIESARVSEIYGNSYLNIAATNAQDGSQGLLQVGKKHRNNSFRAWEYTENGQARLSYHCVSARMYDHSMMQAPLMQRAWVVQERLLQTHCPFYSNQVFWECKQKTACEAFQTLYRSHSSPIEFLVASSVSNHCSYGNGKTLLSCIQNAV